MRKSFTKIICFTAALIVAVGIMLFSACGKTYKVTPLSPDNVNGTAVTSNGGFAVEKGGYVYFINGSQANTADNTFGEVVRGAIMRISSTDLSQHNYSSAQTVVPLVIYSGNSDAGIYIYGDKIYYTTPSTERNSDGEVLNSYLQFKSTKLDGTGTMKDYYIQLSDSATQYRYVEVDGVVYILYVISEDLYGTTYTNLRSYNTETGADTLLAYNVDAVTFDKRDLTNSRVYYTMNVTDYATGTSFSSYYNQIYTVRADATTPNDYKLGEIVADYDASSDPLYINCGTLVYDGVGKIQGITESITPFNGKDAGKVERSAYKYTLSSYENGYIYYTRTTAQNSTAMLFAEEESNVLSAEWNPVTDNKAENECLIRDGSSASAYIYLYAEGKLSGVLITNSTGLQKAEITGGKIPDTVDNDKYFFLTSDGQATFLFLEEHDGRNYIYYSLTGGSGYTINRICYDGAYADYNGLPLTNGVNEYTPVRILDLDASSSWYMPEMFFGQILFATQVSDMVNYPYIMVCDINGENGVMTNTEIDALNKQYEKVSETIDEIDSEIYENLQGALRYAFMTGESGYVNTLIKAYVDVEGRNEEYIWSKQSLEKFNAFIEAKSDGEWAEFSQTRKVNGSDVAANKRDYYYSLLGKMSSADAEEYIKSLQNNQTYFPVYPENEVEGWFENLSTGAKVGFIIGVCAGGIIVIAAAVIVTLVIIRKQKSKLPSYTKKRIKVDTTDDKDIDVYSDEGTEAGSGSPIDETPEN